MRTEYMMSFGIGEIGEDVDATNKRGADKIIALQMADPSKQLEGKYGGTFLFEVTINRIDKWGDIVDWEIYWAHPLGAWVSEWEQQVEKEEVIGEDNGMDTE
tara:strand:+ start:357 stop:662 length:306 start_codon:yes stop_codon:yes gene_type:complete